MMLAAREVTQESTGFSPNDSVFAHSVRAPLAALRDNFVDSDPPKKLVDYVDGFRNRLYVARLLAKENLASAQKKMKQTHDREAEGRNWLFYR